MIPAPRSRAGRGAVLRAAVAIATAVVGIALALAAYEAPQARARFVQATLRDYARYHAATVVDQASWEVLRTLRARLVVRLQLLSVRGGASPAADAWARSGALVDACDCVPALAEPLHFRTDAPLDSLGLRWSAVPDPRVERWLARAVADWLRATPARETWVERFAGSDVPGVAMSAYAQRDTLRGTVAVFGYVADVRPILGIAATDMMERAPLFPSAPVTERANATLVRLVLRTARGDTLFASAPVAAAGAPVRVPRPELGGVEATVVPTRTALALLAPRRAREALVPVLAAAFLGLLAVWGLLLWSLRRQEALVQARGAFVATVSHELRTPLAQILLFAERARDALATDAEERRRALDVVIREAERLSRLADNAIHVAAGSARPVALRRRRTHLPTLVEEIVERFEPLAEDADVRVVLDTEDDVVASVDAAALSQVLLNLLENALRHARGTAEVRVAVRRHGAEGWLVVEDDGPGVPPALREAVWEPFARLEAGAARDDAPTAAMTRSGSGIGLSVVRDLVAAHGGRTWVEAADARGARFVVALPLERAHDEARALPATSSAAPAAVRGTRT